MGYKPFWKPQCITAVEHSTNHLGQDFKSPEKQLVVLEREKSPENIIVLSTRDCIHQTVGYPIDLVDSRRKKSSIHL